MVRFTRATKSVKKNEVTDQSLFFIKPSKYIPESLVYEILYFHEQIEALFLCDTTVLTKALTVRIFLKLSFQNICEPSTITSGQFVIFNGPR